MTQDQENAHNPGLDIAFESNGIVYTTLSGSQNGSVLKIDGSSESFDTTDGSKIKTVWGTFSCKLYNGDDPLDVMEVTNGTFRILLSDFK